MLQSTGTSAMHISYKLRFDGHDLRQVNVTGGAEAVAFCTDACSSEKECTAFTVDLTGPIVCQLKTLAAVKQGDVSNCVSISGWKDGHTPVVQRSRFAHYFHIEADKPVIGHGSQKVLDDGMYKAGLEGWIEFDKSIEEVTIRIGTSFISIDQAAKNIAREIPEGTSFEALAASNRGAWNDLLARTQLIDAGNQTEAEGEHARGTWYTNLYRTAIYPRKLYEISDEGSPIHWSPYDGRVHSGRMSSDLGFWDGYRTVYPLSTILRTNETGNQMEGWINAYKESGSLVSWASPGARGAMTGNMQDASISDAIAKGIGGFDTETAYEALMKDAFSPGFRRGLDMYERHGYIPVGSVLGFDSEVSATLNYALADHSMSLAAEKLGKAADAAKLKNRSRTWRSLFDPSFKGGFFRPRLSSGAWLDPFDELAWGGPYTEASAWQYRFYAPHEPEALAELYGGDRMCHYLSEMMTGGEGTDGPGAAYHKGSWGLHHEQTEMTENCFGQYEHNNQPVWHVLYMFAPAGCASAGQYWLRQATGRLYGPHMYTGDEDNGSMSAWYVLSAIGIYQLTPGSSTYRLGSPMFRHLVLQLDNGRTLEILAQSNSPENVYVQAASLNGVPLKCLTVDYFELMKGGKLEFVMSSKPSSFGTQSTCSDVRQHPSVSFV
mmetsp:Transcript_23407/g.62541  ORF Transcript_23407/g.62541 Transcript_23407/m.62541 type:complete len:662 (+) Transcript_23407:3-1988(+)